MSYFPLSKNDKIEMLRQIGVESIDALLSSVPNDLLYPKLSLPKSLGEMELKRAVAEIANKNSSSSELLSFLGAGAYEHFIPAVVNHICSRSEFYTAYTPYQPESSQGLLQSIYEYQSLICMLSGMDVATASHYDGATSMAEAAIMCATQKKRSKILVVDNVHPHYREVLRTYIAGTAFDVVHVPFDSNGMIDELALNERLSDEVACVIVQSPNFFGSVEDLTKVEELTHLIGAYFVVVSNPLALIGFKSPGEWNADIACGDAQVFGNSVAFGGPHLGYLAVKKSLMRKLPGRLVGVTEDKDGKRSFVLTLQAREQHIRREKATSNICSNQALCALRACVYLTTLGRSGLDNVFKMNFENTNYLKKEIGKLENIKILFDGTGFNEFVIQTKRDACSLRKEMIEKGIDPGLELELFYPELKNTLLICATETKTQEDLQLMLNTLKMVL